MKLKKIVLTGAAGRLGSYLREPLTALCDELVSTDLEDVGTCYPGERFMKADLASFDDMMAVIEGATMVIHMGAFVDEGPFEQLLGPNFIGSYNVWEAAYRTGARRVVYASSIHAVGMYDKNVCLDTEMPHRPDTFYGLAKCFSEDLGRMYWEKRGLESVHMRILSCASVNNPRSLGSYLSYDDLIQLVTRCIDTPVTGWAVVYGVSDNDRSPVDNTKAAFLGYRPKDNAEDFAQAVFAEMEAPLDPLDKTHMCHGGPFASVDLGNSGLAGLNVVDDRKKT